MQWNLDKVAYLTSGIPLSVCSVLGERLALGCIRGISSWYILDFGPLNVWCVEWVCTLTRE